MSKRCPGCGYDFDLVVTEQHEFRLDLVWPSQNALKANTKYNHTYKKVRDEFIVKVATASNCATPAETYRRVFLTRHYGRGPGGGRCRAYDYGNLVGGGKPLLDALVWNGLLVDDKPEYCDDYYAQYPSGDGSNYITIAIQDVKRPRRRKKA